jgi:hypothetical protein
MPDTDSDSIETHKVTKPEDVQKEEAAVAKEELKDAIKGSHEMLASATTVFPFTLFPDTIAVDRTKITITTRKFFSVAEVMSIRIEDILNITANIGPLFGSLRIVSRVLSPDKPYEINYLWRDDTTKLKRILQGYVIAMQKEIDVTPLKTEELTKMLNDLGKDDHT